MQTCAELVTVYNRLAALSSINLRRLSPFSREGFHVSVWTHTSILPFAPRSSRPAMARCTLPPSPTPRAALATPMGASNLDAIINEGTLTIGWVGPALLGILIAAFGGVGV